MRATRSQLASSFMLLVLFVQTGTASPLGSCASALGGHRDMYDHDLAVSGEHGGPVVTDDMPVVARRDAPQNTSPVSDLCVTTAHCALTLAAPVSPGPEVQPNLQAVGERGPSWFPHLALATHVAPPPKT